MIELPTYKAENAGRKLVQVNPRNTSRMCSGCDRTVKNELSCRIHDCLSCGLKIDRDQNTARNITSSGLQALRERALEAASNRQSSHLQIITLESFFCCGCIRHIRLFHVAITFKLFSARLVFSGLPRQLATSEYW